MLNFVLLPLEIRVRCLLSVPCIVLIEDCYTMLDAALEFAAGDIPQALQDINQNLLALRQEGRIGRAESHNAMLRIGNRFIFPNEQKPLQKSVCILTFLPFSYY